MGDIADDHRAALSWSEGVGVGGDCGRAPPSDHPTYGGMDAYIQRNIRHPSNMYRCQYCRSLIWFMNRKPYNLADATPHRCLADAAQARRNVGHAA